MALIVVVSFLLYVASNAQVCPNQDRVCDKEGECCSKFGFCGTGEEWCRETWDFNETGCPDCVCDQPTPEPTQPFEESCMCTCYGDPHCKMWNCETNSWQGPHYDEAIDVYYMTPCNGYTHEDMPFDVIGVNQRYDDYFTSLDYTILKLYGPEGEEICIKHKGADGVSYNTDCGDTYDMTPEQSENTTITLGTYFEMLWYFKNGYSRLYVRNKAKACESSEDWDLTMVTMTATDREESVQISVSDCYKQYTCGMCGDFYHTESSFQTADGSIMQLDTGAWGGTANDETGLSYAVEVEGSSSRRLLQETTAASDSVGEPCYGLLSEMEIECDARMKPWAECCWDRTEWCKIDILAACKWDSCSCLMGNYSSGEPQERLENVMGFCAERILEVSMNFTCGLPGSRFDSPDMSEYGGSSNEEECDECDATGNIFIGILIASIIFGVVTALCYFVVIKPKLQQRMGTGTGEQLYQRM